ncbi:unnamed protein product [Acanthoscelides obtectus]|uniref:SOCS box domain-containing protein n=1 Tax=Acanthoscelides obtectus TaxID=200917 RepID=A0A9P0JKB2_ACAOB|nr:unnamed protein product [Acanthoscelides obtectus]CAK1655052.1 hypothetical protein AOBTE_LOCUS18993 [Acanthoscelides obtectus]
MECFLKCYFEQFTNLPRNSLHDRRKRKAMVQYISTLIQGCSAVEPTVEESSRIAIKTILNYHDEMRDQNGTVCLMGKNHNILYVAMKLCFDWQVQDLAIVSLLLEQIYLCEKTFERILIGAIFGNKAPHYIAGWKSDFETEEENVRAVVYFLDKATNAALELPFTVANEERLFRFVDVPIESCGRASPLKICVQLGIPDKLHIFLRFGARLYTENEEFNVFEHILNRLSEFNHKYPYNLIACLQLLLRAAPWIKIKPKDFTEEEEKILYERLLEKYADLVDDGIVPLSRCGLTPPELKHLCRCVIREKLWENYQLPSGIRSLPVPEQMWKYLDLLED